MFGTAHLILLGLAAVCAAMTLWGVPKLTRPDVVFRTAGWLLLVLSVLYTVWRLLPGQFSWDGSLPLHFSDALRFICAVALLSRPRWAVAIAYYWGLTLNSQALLTPHPSMLGGVSVNMIFYWVLHIAVLLVPLALLRWGCRPSWRDFGTAYAAAVLWTALAMPMNHLLGTNYGFLNRPPEGGSLIDLLGPWPVYVVWLAVLAAVLWAAMTWPWTRRREQPVYDELDVSATMDARSRRRKRI